MSMEDLNNVMPLGRDMVRDSELLSMAQIAAGWADTERLKAQEALFKLAQLEQRYMDTLAYVCTLENAVSSRGKLIKALEELVEQLADVAIVAVKAPQSDRERDSAYEWQDSYENDYQEPYWGC